MKLLKRVVSAVRPKDGPTGICPQCDVEAPSPEETVREWLRGLGHTKDEAHEIEQEMGDLARTMLFGLPPLRESDRESQN
ncbi:MAG: hypothetical protein OXI06_08755 [bacterium]|nr:hypothetical protein [bacterium]